MSHNPSIVLMGGRGSNIADIANYDGDPEVFKAGLAVRKATTGSLQLADDSVAPLIGVSLGSALDDTKRTAVALTGNYIPIRLKNDAATVKIGDITFTAKAWGTEGNDVTITLDDSETGNVAVVDVTDTDITIGIEAGVTTAQTIVNALIANAEASALVSAVIDSGDAAVAQAAATSTPLTGGTDYETALMGKVVKIDDATGEASTDGDATAATYISNALTGVYPDGTECKAAYISILGGF